MQVDAFAHIALVTDLTNIRFETGRLFKHRERGYQRHYRGRGEAFETYTRTYDRKCRGYLI